MQLESKFNPAFKNPISFIQKLGYFINWIYEHTLNYPIVEDIPPIKRKSKEDEISMKIFSGSYNQHSQLFK